MTVFHTVCNMAPSCGHNCPVAESSCCRFGSVVVIVAAAGTKACLQVTGAEARSQVSNEGVLQTAESFLESPYICGISTAHSVNSKDHCTFDLGSRRLQPQKAVLCLV